MAPNRQNRLISKILNPQTLPHLQVHILSQDDCYTCDYRTDRVRIFVDDDQKVIKAPHIG